MRPAIAMRADVDDECARLNVDLVRAKVDEHVERVRLRHRLRVEPALAWHQAEIEPAHARGRAMQHIEAVPPVFDDAGRQGGLGEARQHGDAVGSRKSAGADDEHRLRHPGRRLLRDRRERLRP